MRRGSGCRVCDPADNRDCFSWSGWVGGCLLPSPLLSICPSLGCTLKWPTSPTQEYLPTLQGIPSYSPATTSSQGLKHIVLYYHRAQGKLTEQLCLVVFPRYGLSTVIVYIRHPILSSFYNVLRFIYLYFIIMSVLPAREERVGSPKTGVTDS